MKAVYLKGIKRLVSEEIPIPEPGDNEVLIQVKCVGVCGSDIHYWEHGRIGNFVVNSPLILGHEVAGKIVSMGNQVKITSLKPGDRVIIEPGVPCGHCNHCLKGRYNLCQSIQFFATPPVDGAFREYVSINCSKVFKIADDLPMEVATLAEPLAVAIHAIKRSHIELGERVVIFGAGVVGLSVMLALQEAGLKKITVIDPKKERLSLSQKFGAQLVATSLDFVSNDSLYDIAFECSGSPSALISASKLVTPGGQIVQLGLSGNSTQEVPIVQLITKEINVISVFRYAHVFPTALEILTGRKEQFKEMITHKYSLEDIEDGFRMAKMSPDAIKVVIDVN
ncbi:sorbitol dehydrogenase [Peptococcaceae bacterium CEB3]|nr:sorbitol dehydrogenase [Peptococcaceae bacterium CEB3]